jgi:predicted amidophosphoribosyltransferase
MIGIREILLLMFLACLVAVVFAAFYFLAKYLTGGSGKICPYCAEKIKEAAKICPHCQRDVTGT